MFLAKFDGNFKRKVTSASKINTLLKDVCYTVSKVHGFVFTLGNYELWIPIFVFGNYHTKVK